MLNVLLFQSGLVWTSYVLVVVEQSGLKHVCFFGAPRNMPFNGPEVQEFWASVRASTTHLVCAKCLQKKGVEEFDKSNITLTKRQPKCKECRRKAQKESYEKRGKKYLQDPSKRMAHLVKTALNRAVERGLPFDSKLREILEVAPPTNCACCGRVFDYAVLQGHAGKDASPSLDRLVLEKGYVGENVKVVCWRCNRLKRDVTVKELEAILVYIRKNT